MKVEGRILLAREGAPFKEAATAPPAVRRSAGIARGRRARMRDWLADYADQRSTLLDRMGVPDGAAAVDVLAVRYRAERERVGARLAFADAGTVELLRRMLVAERLMRLRARRLRRISA